MITVDGRGLNCPLPVIKTKQAMDQLTGPETLEVLVDNETAVQNVSKFGTNAGGVVSSEKLGEKEFKITIQMEGAPDRDLDAECVPDNKGDFVMVFASDCMGNGNDELGKSLMKGCIYAVTQLDKLPKTMLFFNGGARLTTEGSDSIEDLKSLEAQGVEIMTCGACLDFYGLKEKLQVGTVTNMYVIVDTMSKAGKVVRP